jgi:hypothetical protein
VPPETFQINGRRKPQRSTPLIKASVIKICVHKTESVFVFAINRATYQPLRCWPFRNKIDLSTSGRYIWNLWCRKWHWERVFFNEYLRFHLSVSFHKCFINFTPLRTPAHTQFYQLTAP